MILLLTLYGELKKGKIARKTLIGKYRNGGLQLIDVKCKMRAFRIKLIKNYLYDPVDYGWKALMGYHLNKVWQISDFTLLMRLKEPMVTHLPEFYEVLMSQAALLKYVFFDCADISLIKQMPLFLNDKLWKGKCHYNLKLMGAGILQIKHLMYEVIPGFLPGEAMCECIYGDEDRRDEARMRKLLEVIMSSIPRKWVELINKEVAVGSESRIPDLYIKHGNQMTMMNLLTLKETYNVFLTDVWQPPASLMYWCRVFPKLQAGQIWGEMENKGEQY